MARASLDELLAEASTPDSSLYEFFESHSSQLHRIRLKDIPFRHLDNIAGIIHGTELRETDWMAFLNELGIVENRAIIWIKLKSKLKQELPIYLALTGPLMERLTFGDVVEVLMKIQRLDALLYIKQFAERLLRRPRSYVAREPTAPEAEELEKEESEDNSSQILNENYQNSHMNMVDKGNDRKIDCKHVLIKAETITILILHADADIDAAEKLCSLLREAGFAAKTLSNFDHLLMMNSFEVIPALISAVDFIVPIVSESFMKQIHSRNHSLMNAFDNVEPSEIDVIDYEEHFSHNSNNHYIYQLILNQYVHNRCLNFSVRPVMVPHFNRNRLIFDVLLRQSYKLWEKVPDFIELLKKTKQLFNKMNFKKMNNF